MKVTHLVILIVFLLVVLQILRKKKNKKKSIQLIKNNLYSELKKRNDKNQKKINELEELLRKEQRWSFYLSVFTVLSICGLSIYIYMLIIDVKKQTKNYIDSLIQNAQDYSEMNKSFLNQEFPFNVGKDQTNHKINITVSDDAENLSELISNNLPEKYKSEKYKQHLKNQIRKFQLELAINYLRFVSN